MSMTLNDVSVEFHIISASDGTLLDNLRSNKAKFARVVGVDPRDVGIVSVSFFPATNSTSSSTSGTIVTLIDLTINVGSLTRRLTQAEPIETAVADSVTILVGPQLPAGAIVDCSVTSTSETQMVANVTVSVESGLDTGQIALTNFLTQDTESTDPQLPQMIAERSGVQVDYSDGYYPVVWSSPESATDKVVNLLPYILAGVGLIVIGLVFVAVKYRFVIKSFFSELWFRVGGNGDSNWTFTSLAANCFNPASLLQRGKSEISSTPDTATNVDEDEFDDVIMRSLRGPGPMQSNTSIAR